MSDLTVQYRCQNPQRRELLRSKMIVNGIDYLEVDPSQTQLIVHFVHDLPGGGGADPVPADPGAALKKEHVRIGGGVRVQNIRVLSIAASGKQLTVEVDAPGDFSTYRLILAGSAQSAMPPPGFDPLLSQVEFSFKVDCPNEFDCRSTRVCPTEERSEPTLDYLAKDYASFRRLMLDRLSRLMPDRRERSPADLQVALVELLAYVGDHLSYFQDAVATEAYLGTARRRVSVRRHARLLDYAMHEGANARAWVCLEVDTSVGPAGLALARGTRVVTQSADAGASLAPAEFDALVASGRAVVFETMHAATLHHAHNRIRLYTWGDSECCLPRGATRATLRYEPSAPVSLVAGDLLIFEEVKDPASGDSADADPSHRHAVRLTRVRDQDGANPLLDPLTNVPIVEIEWAQADALPFPLCVSGLVQQGGTAQPISDVSVARGNVVLADHGRTIVAEPLVPPAAPARGRYRPRLALAPLTYATALSPDAPAAAAMQTDPRRAEPAVTLLGEAGVWEYRRDLLESAKFAPHFVAEVESGETTLLRFGDDVYGRAPKPGAAFTATYRVGNGGAGNVGAEALTRVVAADARITRVRNPLAAAGGTDPESLEQVRLYAPQAFRVPERAVTELDYALMAQRHAEVQSAAATFRWTGSWHTAFVTVDRRGGAAVDAAFEAEMRTHLEPFRMAGYDLEIDNPVFVPLEIVLRVCVESRYFRSDVKRVLLEVYGNYALPDGRRGFFHPDNFSFGQAVYLSELYRVGMQVEGVDFIEVTKFQRWGKAANHELENGVLSTARLEVIRLDNDPSFPENGRIQFDMMGGL